MFQRYITLRILILQLINFNQNTTLSNMECPWKCMLLLIIVGNGNIFAKLIIMVLHKYENIPTAKIFPFSHMVHYKMLYYTKS